MSAAAAKAGWPPPAQLAAAAATDPVAFAVAHGLAAPAAAQQPGTTCVLCDAAATALLTCAHALCRGCAENLTREDAGEGFETGAPPRFNAGPQVSVL